MFEVIWRRYKRGEIDLLDGGVAPRDVATELRVDKGAVKRAVRRLERQALLVCLQGAQPSDYRARSSYAPAALYDGGEAR